MRRVTFAFENALAELDDTALTLIVKFCKGAKKYWGMLSVEVLRTRPVVLTVPSAGMLLRLVMVHVKDRVGGVEPLSQDENAPMARSDTAWEKDEKINDGLPMLTFGIAVLTRTKTTDSVDSPCEKGLNSLNVKFHELLLLNTDAGTLNCEGRLPVESRSLSSSVFTEMGVELTNEKTVPRPPSNELEASNDTSSH